MKKKNTNGNSATAGIGTESYLMIDPKLIVINEQENPRYDYGNLEELMHSIVQNGIQTPLQGYEKNGKYILKDGFRRMKAVELAIKQGNIIQRIPLMVEQKPKNEEERTLEFLIYNEGKPFTMLEQAEVIRRLLNLGWKVTEIVKRTGKARGYIENLILLTKIPMRVKNCIMEDKISSHAVIQIMQAVKGNEEQVINEVNEAIKNAEAQGKTKATPKNVQDRKVKAAGFGSFYKYVEELANALANREDTSKPKEKVIFDLMVAFEDKKPVEKFIEEYFVEKKSKK